MMYEKLLENARLPMHMPGHKRRTSLAPYLSALRADMDITEIDGFDDLHDAHGMIAEAMERAAALWGSRKSFLLVNGSTCGILAGIRALTHRGDTVIVSRGAHKSVFHAIELCGLKPVFVYPPVADGMDIFASLPPEAVRSALERTPDAALVIVTSPTYEGVVSDVAGICAAAHAKGVPVLVDEAHGAHLGLGGGFPSGAVKAGADMVVQSLHKTLPSLTQTAVLHVCGELADDARIEHQLAVFETSSPSYLLMASIDGCLRLLESEPQLLSEWARRLKSFDARVSGLEKLRLPGHGYPLDCFGFDPGKILVYTGCAGISGYQLADALRREYNIEPEYAAPHLLLAMTGVGDTDETLGALAAALADIDARCELTAPPVGCPVTSVMRQPQLETLPEEALERPSEAVRLSEAVGRVCAEYLWAYPPGIPLLIPGEGIDAQTAALLSADGMPPLCSTSGGFPEYVSVIS